MTIPDPTTPEGQLQLFARQYEAAARLEAGTDTFVPAMLEARAALAASRAEHARLALAFADSVRAAQEVGGFSQGQLAAVLGLRPKTVKNFVTVSRKASSAPTSDANDPDSEEF